MKTSGKNGMFSNKLENSREFLLITIVHCSASGLAPKEVGDILMKTLGGEDWDKKEKIATHYLSILKTKKEGIETAQTLESMAKQITEGIDPMEVK